MELLFSVGNTAGKPESRRRDSVSVLKRGEKVPEAIAETYEHSVGTLSYLLRPDYGFYIAGTQRRRNSDRADTARIQAHLPRLYLPEERPEL